MRSAKRNHKSKGFVEREEIGIQPHTHLSVPPFMSNLQKARFKCDSLPYVCNYSVLWVLFVSSVKKKHRFPHWTSVCARSVLRLIAACLPSALWSQIICTHTSPPTLSHCPSFFSGGGQWATAGSCPENASKLTSAWTQNTETSLFILLSWRQFRLE